MGTISIDKLSKITGLGDAVGAINALIDAVASLVPIESPTVKPSYTSNGISYRAISEKKGTIKQKTTDSSKALFDLIQDTNTKSDDSKTVASDIIIAHYGQHGYALQILGSNPFPPINDGTDWHNDGELGWRKSVSNSSTSEYVYILIDRANVKATITSDTNTIPQGTDSTEVCPLWYVEINQSSNVQNNTTNSIIDFSNCVNLQTTIRLDGMN